MFPWDSSNNLANFMLQQSEEIHQNNMNRIRQDMNDSTHRTNLAIAQREANEAAFRAQNMESDLGFYRKLLTRPMHEIAKYSLEFKSTYRASENRLCSFMLALKAFRSVACTLGAHAGMAEAVIDALMLQNAESLFENKHPTDSIEDGYKEYLDVARKRIFEGLAEKYEGYIPYINCEDKSLYFKKYQDILYAENPPPVVEGPPVPPPGYKFKK